MSCGDDDWRPTCSIETLHVRAALLQAIRSFFAERGYLEVETPLLSQDVVVDTHLHPFSVLTDQGWRFLQTSPEAGMKRLLAAGSGSIFQISRSFRSGEFGDRHNPEFTIVEWYGVATTHEEQMDLTEQLVRLCLSASTSHIRLHSAAISTNRPFLRTTYDDAFERATGCRVIGCPAVELLQIARATGAVLPDALDLEHADDILNALLAILVEPQLGRHAPEFLCDYPASQAALARTSTSNPHVAHRFELYINGIELCNGYYELTDVPELRLRDEQHNSSRVRHGETALPGAPRMMQAMRRGLPNCSGVALGFDRLVMLATGATTLRDVIPFPFDRA